MFDIFNARTTVSLWFSSNFHQALHSLLIYSIISDSIQCVQVYGCVCMFVFVDYEPALQRRRDNL